MKIVYITDGINRVGGIQTLSKELIKRTGGKHIDLPMSIPSFFKGIFLFFKLFKYRSYDIFHSMNVLPSGYYVSMFCHLFNKQCVISVYGKDVLSALKNPGRKRNNTLTALNQSKIIYCSKSTKKLIERRVRELFLEKAGFNKKTKEYMEILNSVDALKECYVRATKIKGMMK